MTDVWISCEVSDGPMERELVVVVQAIDGRREAWVAKEDVQYLDGRGRTSGKLRVRVRDEAEDRKLVELPGEVPSGTRLVWISSKSAA